jgi:RNA polymerase sigma-70 factor (ECF subfamily)
MPDAERFEAFLRAHQNKVYATAVRLVGRPSDAEDIAQTTFLRAWERFDALCDNPAAGGWLTTVATNLALNHLSRHRSRWRLFSELSSADAGEPGFDESIAAPSDAGDPVARADENARLERALRALPPHQRVPIVLFHFDEQNCSRCRAAARFGRQDRTFTADAWRSGRCSEATMAPAEREMEREILEREIHDALRRLPEPRAPRTLAPRVMQAVAAAAQTVAPATPASSAPGWRQWPLQWQLLGLVAASSMAAALVLALPLASAWIGSLPVTRAAAALWQTFVAPVAAPVLIFTAVMGTACALLVGALKHVAWEGQETHS